MNRNNLWQYLGNNMLESQPNTNQYTIGKDVSSYIPNQEFVQNILTEKQTLEPSVNPKTKVGLREKLSNALLGRQEAPTEYVDLSGIDTNSPEFLENTGGIVDVSISKNPKVGGLLPDIAAGYRENSASPLELNNLQTNITPDGRNKGAAYRFGEFAGTAARLLDNPLVRGGIAYGLSKIMGDRRPLVEGLTAAVGTQQNRMKDRIYRNSLIEQARNSLRNQDGFNSLTEEEQQAQLDNIANQMNSIRGYVGDDTYKQVLAGMQLRDNAEYRNALLAGQRKDQEMAIQQRQAELRQRTLSDAADRALKNRELDIKEKEANKPKPLSDSQVKDLKGTTDFLTSLENIESRYSNDKYDSMFGIKGDIRRNNPLSRYDAEASLFKQDVEILRQRYAKLLEGGRLSDSDRAFYQKALFNPNVSRSDFLEAVRRMKATLMQDYNNALSLYSKQGKDIAGFELTPTQQVQTQTQAQTTTNADAIVNKLKQNGYSDAEISEYLRMKGY